MNTLLDSYLSEMANLDYVETGVNKIKMHAHNQGDKQLPHGPRIKVSNFYEKFRDEDCFSINILTLKVAKGKVKIKPKELKEVEEWVELRSEEHTSELQ